MPSGNLRPSLTITFKSEPSGFEENTRPPPTSKKNNRPEVGVAMGFVIFDFAIVDDIELLAPLRNFGAPIQPAKCLPHSQTPWFQYPKEARASRRMPMAWQLAKGWHWKSSVCSRSSTSRGQMIKPHEWPRS